MKKFLLFITIIFVLSSCGCYNRWVEVVDVKVEPAMYVENPYDIFGDYIVLEEQKYMTIKCRCGIFYDVGITDYIYYNVNVGDTVFLNHRCGLIVIKSEDSDYIQ